MTFITDVVRTHLPPNHKVTPSGWIKFNAVCCQHNGESVDKKQRGGMKLSDDNVSYHCFNCGFKTSWAEGRTIGKKFRSFLQWLGVTDDIITKCVFAALRSKEDAEGPQFKQLMPEFFKRDLPKDSQLISELVKGDIPAKLITVLEYIASRGMYIDDYDWYWSPAMPNRLIVPFYYKNKIVGYTGRAIDDAKPKYLSEQQPGFVFNLDRQTYDKEFVIVCEGPLDAISVDGIAVLSQEITAGQHLLINQLQKRVIVVPDHDSSGKQLVEQAVEFGWSVSFPVWPDDNKDIKDINQAVQEYGRLFVLWNILQHVQDNKLKIQITEKLWF